MNEVKKGINFVEISAKIPKTRVEFALKMMLMPHKMGKKWIDLGFLKNVAIFEKLNDFLSRSVFSMIFSADFFAN